MKAKRPAQPPSAGERRGGQASASRKSGQRVADSTPARRNRARTGKPTAPAREPRTSRSAPQTTPVARPVERPARAKSATQAKARAKARKAKAPKVVRLPLRERLLSKLTSIDIRPRTLAAKVPFVVLVIGSLGAGLALTLWLSTDAAERSYQLGSARQRTELLQQEKEALERDVQAGAVRAGVGRGGSRSGHDPDPRHRASGSGPRRKLGSGGHPQAGPGCSAAATEQQAAGRKADVPAGSAGQCG